jgi:hypothetical protein
MTVFGARFFGLPDAQVLKLRFSEKNQIDELSSSA